MDEEAAAGQGSVICAVRRTGHGEIDGAPVRLGGPHGLVASLCSPPHGAPGEAARRAATGNLVAEHAVEQLDGTGRQRLDRPQLRTTTRTLRVSTRGRLGTGHALNRQRHRVHRRRRLLLVASFPVTRASLHGQRLVPSTVPSEINAKVTRSTGNRQLPSARRRSRPSPTGHRRGSFTAPPRAQRADRPPHQVRWDLAPTTTAPTPTPASTSAWCR